VDGYVQAVALIPRDERSGVAACEIGALGWTVRLSRVDRCAQGGSDFDLDRLVALCPPCHAQTDAPYARGRLVVMPSGSGRFILELWEGTGKETRQVVERWESPWFPSTMEPASGLARIGHHRTNSEGSDADQARP
jgi:hypothetical protein